MSAPFSEHGGESGSGRLVTPSLRPGRAGRPRLEVAGLRLGPGWAAAPQEPGPALCQEARQASGSFCLGVSQWMVCSV